MNTLDMLKVPFLPRDIEWRVCRSGVSKAGAPWVMALAYIDNRAIMDRLDNTVGPQNWRNEYTQAPCGGILCGLSIKIGGEWITKWDGADNTDVEATKGGLSGSMKRAAVQWGVGRYLYGLTENFATVIQGKQEGSHSSKVKGVIENKGYVNWLAPTLPDWAQPSKQRINKEQMQSTLMALLEAITNQDSSLAIEVMGELTEKEQIYLWNITSSKQKAEIHSLTYQEEAA